MKKESAETIDWFAEVKVEIDEEYSGRGMYGETTYAIHAESLIGLFQNLSEIALRYMGEDGEDPDYEDVKRMLEAMADMKRWDSSGKGVVIY